jgi:uncharacterized protein (TIGR02594 family)
MMRILLAVIVAMCAFANPSLADTNKARPHLMEGRSALNMKSDRQSRSSGRDVVALAERYIGTNPTTMRRLWCANFVGLMEKKVGRAGTGSNMARSYDQYGKKISRGEVRRGDIAVMSRGKRGGHVGYFVEWAPNGKAVIISGNSRGGKVSKGQYALSRIYSWRRPA